MGSKVINITINIGSNTFDFDSMNYVNIALTRLENTRELNLILSHTQLSDDSILNTAHVLKFLPKL